MASTMSGVGVITATALVATIGDGAQFRSGRQVSAWLGLVPRRPTNVVLVAMANKTARVAWALLGYERIYQPTPA